MRRVFKTMYIYFCFLLFSQTDKIISMLKCWINTSRWTRGKGWIETKMQFGLQTNKYVDVEGVQENLI